MFWVEAGGNVILSDPGSEVLICVNTILIKSIGPKVDRAQSLFKVLPPILISGDKMLHVHFAHLKSKRSAAVEGARVNGNSERIRLTQFTYGLFENANLNYEPFCAQFRLISFEVKNLFESKRRINKLTLVYQLLGKFFCISMFHLQIADWS